MGPRGFTSSIEHDEAIIKNWNEVVGPDDIVYHCGDLMLGDNAYGIECVKRLNGTIKLIRGNHDTDTRWKLYATLPNIECLGWAEVIKYKKYNFYLSHHPTITSNFDFDKPIKARLINLAGHTHTKNKFEDMKKGLIYHIELDAQNNYPVNIEYIIEEINNFGYKWLI